MKGAILSGRSFSEIPEIEKHAEWYAAFSGKYEFTEENTEGIIKNEIGNTFVRVLCDAGVYKDTDEGLSAFMRFVERVNNG